MNPGLKEIVGPQRNKNLFFSTEGTIPQDWNEAELDIYLSVTRPQKPSWKGKGQAAWFKVL